MLRGHGRRSVVSGGDAVSCAGARSVHAATADVASPDDSDERQQERIAHEQSDDERVDLRRVRKRSGRQGGRATDADQRQNRKRKNDDAPDGEQTGKKLGGVYLDRE